MARLIDNNREQFETHRLLAEYALMLDPFYFECLEQLTGRQQQQQQQEPNESSTTSPAVVEDVYKSCMWNSRVDQHYLAALTRSNQLVLFDCTRLGGEQRENVIEDEEEEEAAAADEKSHSRVFDSPTRSRCLNVTEMWAAEFKSSEIYADRKWKSIEDYLNGLDQIVPVMFAWSESPVVLEAESSVCTTARSVEILFVAFKSNEIACFLIADNLEVKIIQLFIIFDYYYLAFFIFQF